MSSRTGPRGFAPGSTDCPHKSVIFRITRNNTTLRMKEIWLQDLSFSFTLSLGPIMIEYPRDVFYSRTRLKGGLILGAYNVPRFS